MHTKNLQDNSRASLFVAEPDALGDPVAWARATLLGTVVQVPPAAAAPIHMTRHKNARQWQNFSDFAYYRMTVASAYFIAKFGQMGWIPGEEYCEACPST